MGAVTYTPGADKHLLKDLVDAVIMEAYRRSVVRRDATAFHLPTVQSIIRGSWVRIKPALQARQPFLVSVYFKMEPISKPIDYSRYIEADGNNYLMPNEQWAGKGSAGKNNISSSCENVH